MTTRLEAPAAPFRADTTVPGDKSLSHRALILAAMATGRSRIARLAPGEDVAATIRALRSLGVEVTSGVVVSPGVDGWRAPSAPIDAANSGTTLRLLAGALAGRPFVATLIGDASLMRRPMRRLVAPLSALGARIEVSREGTAPVTVHGGALRGTRVAIPVASAQVRSAVALAALGADGVTVIDSPPGFRDHTERALMDLGRGQWESETAFAVAPGAIDARDRAVPGDPSSAAFLLAAAALRPGARVTVRGVCLNPGRTGFLDVLNRMGASVCVEVAGDRDGEPVGDVTVAGAPLHGTTISGRLTVRCLDELPLLALVGAAASGPTVIADAGELRAKESDRIASTAAMLGALGAHVATRPDGLEISGGAPLRLARIDAGGDHRIAMTAAVAATVAGAIEIDGFSVAAVSWPGFAEALEGVWSSR